MLWLTDRRWIWTGWHWHRSTMFRWIVWALTIVLIVSWIHWVAVLWPGSRSILGRILRILFAQKNYFKLDQRNYLDRLFKFVCSQIEHHKNMTRTHDLSLYSLSLYYSRIVIQLLFGLHFFFLM